MFGWMHRLRSFGEKLSWLLTLTAGSATLLVCSVLAMLDYLEMRSESLASLHSQAHIVAMSSGAPMAFDDIDNAHEALAAFRLRRGVAEATLFDLRGSTFARYEWDIAEPPQLPPLPPGSRWHGRWYVLVLPIEDREQTLGRLQVVFDGDRISARLWRNLLLTAIASLVVVGLVYLMSLRIRDVLMRPIAALGHTAERIAASGDYALRAAKFGDDELGRFTDAFNDMLAQIEKQDRELQAARADAEAASRVKDEFLATLSHELRTPLTPILGWAQILSRFGGDDPRLRQASQVIERSARTQAQIIDDLLDMSRIVSGKLRLEIQPVDLVEVIEAAMDTVRPAADGKQVQLSAELSPVTVRGDPHRLQQIVWNLLSNAIKFTDSGGEVRIALRHRDRHAVIVVSDSGQGISAGFLPHVFERFRQADSSTTRSHGGLGLGLAIVRQLAELHGGSVRAASAGIGHGATFSVLLPINAAEPDRRDTAERRRTHRPTPLPPTRVPSLQGVRALLVIEDSDAATLIRQMLGDDGASVEVADDADAALLAVRHAVPDVLVVDLGLADGGAFTLLEALRAVPAEAGGTVPAVALTAAARSEERTGALLAGFQLHVTKPVRHDELRAAVASLVRGRGGAGGEHGDSAAGSPPP